MENGRKIGGERQARGVHRHSERRRTRSRGGLFDAGGVPEDARKILENFSEISGSVRGMSARQRALLPNAIRELSHSLTDERGTRRPGYMNGAETLSAYISYFAWWNLVRLVRLFSNLPKRALALEDGSVALDIGSGPLTVPTALWLARPDLRRKKMTWYCLDTSQNALGAGEEIFLSVAARTLSEGDAGEPWKIVRVRGEFGTEIRERADLVTCANTFNEMIQKSGMPTDFLAKKFSGEIEKYLKPGKSAAILLEPGDPHSARFVSLMRSALMRRGFAPVSPCTHCEECPMAGRSGRRDSKEWRSAKWCNFAFGTDDAPKELLSLSQRAGLPKDRATLSFVVCQGTENLGENLTEGGRRENSVEIEKSEKSEKSAGGGNPGVGKNGKTVKIRIASDPIFLPEMRRTGFYACSERGLLLAVDSGGLGPKSGDLLEISIPEGKLERDQKSGAKIVRI